MSLGEIQRRLWRLIAWPEGIHAALREESADAPPLKTLIKSDEQLAAEDRLDVYANAYFYRIHDVLAEDFPTLPYPNSLRSSNLLIYGFSHGL